MSPGALVLVSLVALFLGAGTATAQATSAAESQVRLGDVMLGWPATADGLITPGTQIVVRIRDNRSARRVRITLTRLDGPKRVVARASLRHGSFTPRVARRVGARYVLRAAVGKRRHQVRFSVAAPRMGPCSNQGGVVRGELRLGATSARPGDFIPATFANTGEACLSTGLSLQWERLQPDGTYVRVPGLPVPTILYFVEAGGTRELRVWVWDTLEPGEYRAVLGASVGGQLVEFTAGPFTIVP